MGKTSQKNSFVSLSEQIQQLNNNSVEILTGINDVVSGTGDSINVTYTDEQGNETAYSLPTVGYLQQRINEINNNINRLVGETDSSTYVIDGKSTKRSFLIDLNREPNKINTLDKVDKFSSTNNWFFESLMNPMLSVNFDLTEKVQESTDGAISRRYIVKFEKDDDGNYTEKGLASLNDFKDKFVGKDNINLNTFTDWYTNPTNTGVINNTDPIYDEQIFDFEYQEISESGVFSVLKQELDSINNKLWYHIYPFNYVTSSGSRQALRINDELILNKENSNTRWKIVETSVADSNYRIRVERVEGFEPIPTATDILKIYGSSATKKEVKVSIGFDEYVVIFMKPINSKNKLKSSTWSDGTGLYTNDLILDTDNSISMSQYYLDTVDDYGSILNDLIQKNIPTKYGVSPDAPILRDENFKVVQINKHLTDNDDSNEVKKMHSQKVNVKNKLLQVRDSIIQKNREISTKNFTSSSEKNKSYNELTRLTAEQETYSKNLYSLTREIKSKKDTVNKIEPKFRVRGFWLIPDGKKVSGQREQMIVQFKIQYRYSSKSGTENQTEAYKMIDGKTGYFSNWIPLNSDARKRVFNSEKNEWEWIIEDVSDADTPNINQLDIPLNPDEKVEIRVKSVSEVGFPDSALESVWSESITIEFPDELSNILSSNDYILEDAEKDNVLIEFEQTLESKGINKHINDSYTEGDIYVAHKTDKIQTPYKDENGVDLNLEDYLEYLTDKMSKLENIIYSAKGELKVTLYNGIDETVINNGSDINIDIILQDHGLTRDGVLYGNNISIIKKYFIKIKNLSTQSTLGFLVSDTYSTSNTTVRSNDTINLTSLVNKDNNFVIQENNQFIYFCDNYQGNSLYEGDISHNTAEDGSLLTYLKNTSTNVGLSSNYINAGRTGNENGELYPATGKVVDNTNEWYLDSVAASSMATLICPQVEKIDDLIVFGSDKKELSTNDELIIPINIYWLFLTTGLSTISINNDNQVPFTEHNKKLKVRMHPTSLDKPFDFVLSFNIKNKRL